MERSLSFTLCLLKGKLSEPNCDFNSGRVANNQSDRDVMRYPRHAISRAKEKKGRRVEGEERERETVAESRASNAYAVT